MQTGYKRASQKEVERIYLNHDELIHKGLNIEQVKQGELMDIVNQVCSGKLNIGLSGRDAQAV